MIASQSWLCFLQWKAALIQNNCKFCDLIDMQYPNLLKSKVQQKDLQEVLVSHKKQKKKDRRTTTNMPPNSMDDNKDRFKHIILSQDKPKVLLRQAEL